jgi:hypothetical protein
MTRVGTLAVKDVEDIRSVATILYAVSRWQEERCQYLCAMTPNAVYEL